MDRPPGTLHALPLLDIAAFRRDPGSAGGRAFVDELRAACHEGGFLYLTGHGVPPHDDLAIQTVARSLFALPDHELAEIENVHSPQFRGFTRSGGEYTAGRPDRREQLDIGPEEPAPVLSPDSPAWMRLRGPNLWPTSLPTFRPVVERWLAELDALGDDLLRALALSLGQPADCFDPLVDPRPDFRLKIIRYPGADSNDPDDGASQGLGAHRDAGFLSIILQDDTGGLQVASGEGFVDVPALPGTYVVNLGEMVQLVTNGYYTASVHRVVSPPAGRDRISVAYFHNPAMHATLRPVELPPELAAHAPGGASTDPSNPILSEFGLNTLKVRLRSHPEVSARHHADLLERWSIQRPVAADPASGARATG